MAKIKVSFVLGIYNADRTLEECLNSIFMQDYSRKNYEVIVVDGGSTDRTLDMVKNFQKKFRNLKLFHNPKRLSEGRGMSKDIGVRKSKGEIVVFLDHDNIIIGKDWTKQIVEPFKDKEVMASQSLLQYRERDSLFLKYVNALGVEDPFAIPYSLTAQITLNSEKFKVEKEYYEVRLNPNNVLFVGANGCAFRKDVFSKIGGYTRDVDISKKMSEKNMVVVIPLKARVHHKTATHLWSFMKKKGLYFYRFIKGGYKTKDFNWASQGESSGTLRFFLMVLLNLSFIPAGLTAAKQIIKTREIFWIIHPFLVFYLTLEYGILTIINMKNFIEYVKSRS